MIIILYYLIVIIKGYLETPRLISERIEASSMPLDVQSFSKEYLHILLTVEDPNFFSHNGIDLKTPGAGVTTITQGLAKRLYFKPFRPGIAKIKQLLLAFVLDQRIDKQTQLNLFVNIVYLGTYNDRSIEGFEAAAQTYFNKDFASLTREEYLSLVAMIIGPNGFNVKTHPEKNAERVRRVERLLNGECKPSGLMDVYFQNCG
jgi:membrane carboxypeptidase/penicillin-binding protein